MSSYFGVILDKLDFAQSARRARRKSPRRAQRIARPVQRAHGTGNARANFRFPRALHPGLQKGLGPRIHFGVKGLMIGLLHVFVVRHI